MKLQFSGHDYKYAVEQMLATVFPGEKPDYSPGRRDENGMIVNLNESPVYTTATCIYRSEKGRFLGKAAVKTESLCNATERDRLCQFAIKNAVYRAVLASGLERPPWGALTGVRPGKLMHAIIRQSADRGEAISRFETEFDVTRQRAELCYETSLATIEAEQTLTEKDVCLYIGIPFCPTRCAYCSFVSQATEKSITLMDPFLDALQREVKANAEQVKNCGLRVIAIYAGGGTPTTLSVQQLDHLCKMLEKEFDLSALREYSVEAGRPDTITKEKLLVLREHGVSRVSVNPQTMRDSVLEAIGRRHTAGDIYDALEKVRQVGGFAINMDLIAGLPKDDPDGFAASLNEVLALKPENITIHTLSLKKGSCLMRERGEIPPAEDVGVMLGGAYMALKKEGYSPYYLYRQKNMSGGYENSGWTKPGGINLYNICMMEELCSILASGGGGSTKLIHPKGGKNIRITAPKYPLEYIQQIEKICEEKRKIGEFYGI
ncbi:MAG: coproporphyrinogen dehydrogenase HemZ [Oscillospiraceae bacterium]|nr:coproporphyrinogen dehydrogenase HemZ [Oscillospiraceae bacterium]